MKKAFSDFLSMSSGTIATMTNLTKYDDIDAFRYDVILWAKKNDHIAIATSFGLVHFYLKEKGIEVDDMGKMDETGTAILKASLDL